MKETYQNGEKSNFGPDFDLFDPNLGPKKFFVDFISTSS